MQHVFIVGSKGIPANYGGYETFVEKLTENQVSPDIKYHVACAVDDASEVGEFEHNGAHCFKIKRRPIGAANAITYDTDALKYVVDYIQKNHIEHPIVYVLACRIGPFVGRYVKRIHALGGVLYVNPDGHEWMRAKWSAPVRKYWKVSERGVVKHADLLICDSKTIEAYIQSEYADLNPKTTFIAYGADTTRSTLSDDDPKYTSWLAEKGLRPNEYYLVVGRFVPENNYETMIREFMTSNTKKDFALITGINEDFLAELQKRTNFRSDPRIKFVGTVYDQDLLKKIRENAFAYLHGHEVGGTNPSLLEALASTKLNLLLDVGFNREVAGDSALYWNKEPGNLGELINRLCQVNKHDIEKYDVESLNIIREFYTWNYITQKYEEILLNNRV